MRHRWIAVSIATIALVLTACGGEAFIEYRGTVTAAAAGGHSFDAGPPAAFEPVAGARVTLRLCSESCGGDEPGLETTTRVDGSWGPLDLAFGAGFADHEVRIDVSAPGYASYVYSTIYEDTDDPTSGGSYLNVRLAPG